jgi:hypothetical protein
MTNANIASLGQTFGPERFQGTVQFGMCLLRPFIGRGVSSLDRVHTDPVLRKLWRAQGSWLPTELTIPLSGLPARIQNPLTGGFFARHHASELALLARLEILV